MTKERNELLLEDMYTEHCLIHLTHEHQESIRRGEDSNTVTTLRFSKQCYFCLHNDLVFEMYCAGQMNTDWLLYVGHSRYHHLIDEKTEKQVDPDVYLEKLEPLIETVLTNDCVLLAPSSP